MARDFPAFLFYPEDFVAGTAAMSPLAVGVYMRCLCHQWHSGSVPDDMKAIARITGATPDELNEAWPSVSEKFSRVKGGFQNKRLEEERAKLKRRKKAGKKAAEARWQGECESDANDDAISDAESVRIECDSHTSRVANANANGIASDPESALAGSEQQFEQFWSTFPPGRKKTKGRARAAFAKAIKKTTAETITVAAAEYAQSDEGRGQFVKMPETWLNGECWNDDREAWKERSGRRDNSAVSQGSRERSL